VSDWRPGCEALFEAGRAAEGEPTEEDRERVARRIAAQLAGGAAIAAASGALRSAGAGAAGAGGSLSKGWLALAAPKVVAAIALGIGAAGAVAVVTAKPSGVTRARAAAPVVAPAPPSATPAPARLEAPPAAPIARREGGVTLSAPMRSPARVAPEHLTARACSPPLPSASAPSAAPADPSSSPRSSPPSPSLLEPATRAHDTGGELRLVRAADDALRRGDYRAATEALDEHDAAFGAGHFGEECAAARVLAVCGAEGGETGRRAACAFASRYPHSPMNERLSVSCAARCK
jgi:hypothetical protein